MLKDSKLDTVLSTTDIERAKKFYGETLGLTPNTDVELGDDAMFETSKGNRVYIYQRSDAPKAENTVACFQVTDLEAEMADLRAKEVKFEEYDFPGLKTENGIATLGNLKSAWFKDPDGNILCLNQVG